VKTSYIVWVLSLWDMFDSVKLVASAFHFLLFFRKYSVLGFLDLEDEATMILQNTGVYLPINVVNIPEDLELEVTPLREPQISDNVILVRTDILSLYMRVCVRACAHLSQEQFVPYFCVTIMPFQCSVLLFNLQLNKNTECVTFHMIKFNSILHFAIVI